jgi:tetratricopeptide (TPR) repeat protein
MYFYEIQGLFEEAEGVFRNIVRRMEGGSQSGQLASEQAGYTLGRALMYHGWYCMRLARFDQAIELTQEGLALCRQSGDLEGYGLGLNSLGVFATAQGKPQQAKAYLLEALEVLPEESYPWARAGVLGNLGTIASTDGDLSLSAELFQQSLGLYTRLADEWGVANMLGALGRITLRQGDLELAEKRLLEGIKIRQKLGHRWRIADSLNNLGDVACRRQRYAEASRHYQDSLAILQDYGDRVRIAETLVRYGEVCIALGENEQARESLHSSFKIAKEIGADGTLLRALLAMAVLLVKEGEREQAVQILATISEHPSLEHEDRTKAGNLLTEIQAGLSPSAFQTALEKGKTIALDDLTRHVFISLR